MAKTTRVPMRGHANSLKATAPPPQAEPKIAEAVGAAAKSHVEGLKRGWGTVVQDAMTNAIKEAQAAGITDQDEIRRRMMAAKDAAIEKFSKGEAE